MSTQTNITMDSAVPIHEEISAHVSKAMNEHHLMTEEDKMNWAISAVGLLDMAAGQRDPPSVQVRSLAHWVTRFGNPEWRLWAKGLYAPAPLTVPGQTFDVLRVEIQELYAAALIEGAEYDDLKAVLDNALKAGTTIPHIHLPERLGYYVRPEPNPRDRVDHDQPVVATGDPQVAPGPPAPRPMPQLSGQPVDCAPVATENALVLPPGPQPWTSDRMVSDFDRRRPTEFDSRDWGEPDVPTAFDVEQMEEFVNFGIPEDAALSEDDLRWVNHLRRVRLLHLIRARVFADLYTQLTEDQAQISNADLEMLGNTVPREYNENVHKNVFGAMD
ncbi:hypothetical protein BV25DRAFT_1843373 [Artomyces pyxidatus]|uniref:Uncharacterized protein n=1 Tax=Artomyces pyxidatus TaxID=48021 RepID=A0ACB8SGM1_9AGAM|nr:hypothetical protein BV25DRAFT_1843373 [Artomyces pyxidatus]